MQVDEDDNLPMRWVQWRHNGVVGVVFRPDVTEQERAEVIADWGSRLGLRRSP